jgi:Fuc2NAc and GlcNAc transferase
MMDWYTLALCAVIAMVLSWLLTGAMRRYALASQLIDRPNERSSHKVPTPRGGGVAIVVTFLIGLAALGLAGRVEWRLVVATIVGGLVVAILGFLDDRSSLSVSRRFLGQLAAGIWVLAWLGGVPTIPIFGFQVNLGLFGPLLSLLFFTWMINLFNFMDGIDGIASVEAISVSLGGAWLWYATGSGNGWAAALLFAGCVAGFLVWNFPPARIFMGDVGSGFLGLVVATLALWCGHGTPALFWSWFILVGCFMVDATTTLVRRVRRGDRFSEPHRSHAYQYGSRLHGSHKCITLAVLAVNALWLLPLATLVAFGRLDGVLGVAIAYVPLVALAFHYKAGDRTRQEA